MNNRIVSRIETNLLREQLNVISRKEPADVAALRNKIRQGLAEGYNTTLSVLILESFLINEGPKWEKVKKGMKKVGRGAVTAAAVGSIALAGRGGAKISNAYTNYVSDLNTNIVDSNIKRNELYKNMINDIDNMRNDENLTYETKKSIQDQLTKNYRRDLETNERNKENRDTQIANRRNDQHAQGDKSLVGAAGLGVVPLAAGAHALGAKGEREKQKLASLMTAGTGAKKKKD